MARVVGRVVHGFARGEAGPEHDHEAEGHGEKRRESSGSRRSGPRWCSIAGEGWRSSCRVSSKSLRTDGFDRGTHRRGRRPRAGEPASPTVTRSRAQDANRAGLRAHGGRLRSAGSRWPATRHVAAAHGSLRPLTVAGAAPALPRLRRLAHRLPVSPTPRNLRGAGTRSRNRAIQENVPRIVNRSPAHPTGHFALRFELRDSPGQVGSAQRNPTGRIATMRCRAAPSADPTCRLKRPRVHSGVRGFDDAFGPGKPRAGRAMRSTEAGRSAERSSPAIDRARLRSHRTSGSRAHSRWWSRSVAGSGTPSSSQPIIW